ncbi:hypothetical protein IB244_19865 [Rhizobium sp. RHZ02]|jgi:hypothetical protein|uniref:hypothetical protein n=1 Tax=unclassified Rhizobium TaxID=2613769 RepID=UPI0003691EA9|nr:MULTISPECIES: hypothetical protein [unclassified Rhizobium]MBD9453785.1 hypothetical protein [Rhizobium sp. RHZ02]
MQLIDPNHPAYRPLWARILIVAVCFGWALVEMITGDPFWAVLSGGAGVYAAYMLFWNYKPQSPEADTAPSPDDAEEAEDTEAKKDAD